MAWRRSFYQSNRPALELEALLPGIAYILRFTCLNGCTQEMSATPENRPDNAGCGEAFL